MIFTSYPCNSAIPNKGNWYWMSEKLQNTAIFKEVTFKGEFDMIKRLKRHSIVFMATPFKVKIEVS